MNIKYLAIMALVLSPCMASGWKIDPVTLEIRFENHHFTPQTLTVPAGTPIELKVTNASAERIEFESFKLNREKVVDPGASATVRLPALKAGSYDFFDDFHSDVPEGAIVAK